MIEQLLAQSDPANAILLVGIYWRLRRRLDRLEAQHPEV